MADAVDKASAPDGDGGGDGGTALAFFYGTLMAPEVFFTVCYRTSRPAAAIAQQHGFRAAVLPGFTRHRVQGEDYPGVVADAAAGAAVRGVLVGGLTSGNLFHLDVFEGSQYERRTVSVALVDAAGQPTGATAAAQTYVFRDAGLLERRPWDYDAFRRDKLRHWTRAGHVFDDCDVNDPATVAN